MAGATPSTADLRLGDCREILPTLPDASVDAVITDPPYGTEIARDGYGRRQNYGGTGRTIEGDGDLSALDGMLAAAGRVLKPNSWLIVFCSPKRHAEVARLCEQRGFPVGGEVVWDKASPGLGGGIRYQHEIILLCKHGKPTGRGELFSVIRAFLPREGRDRRHPHEKPLVVLRRLVDYASRPGETVLDPFMGSGTTGDACLRAGRRFIGIEIDPGYHADCLERLGEVTPDCRYDQRTLFA